MVVEIQAPIIRRILTIVCFVCACGTGSLTAQTAPKDATRTLKPKPNAPLYQIAPDVLPRSVVVAPFVERVSLPAVDEPKTREAIGSREKRYVKRRHDLVKGGVVYDARGLNLFFPLASPPRRFRSADQFAEVVRFETNGVVYKTTDGKPGVAAREIAVGASYWVHPRTRAIYQVTSPILASIGGESGRIFIGRREVCVDPDRSCVNGLPSYLKLVVAPRDRLPSLVRPPCIGTGEASRCVDYHSFFNKVPLVAFNWARHGANTKLTVGPAREVTRLNACPTGTPSPEADIPVESLRVTFRTGGDDLRDSSHAMMTVTLAARDGLPAPPSTGDLAPVSLNEGQRLSDNTFFTSRPIPLPRGTLLGHISRIDIFHDSRQRNLLDTRDNWNVDEFNVVANVVLTTESSRERRETRDLIGIRGAPLLHRFSGDAPHFALDVVPGEHAEICFEPIARAAHLSVLSSTLLDRTTDVPGAPEILRAIVALSPVSGTGVESVETALIYVGAGFELNVDANFVPTGAAPATAPTDIWIWAADGICSTHSAGGFVDGATGNADHDC